jgi:hypothetical protein
MLKMEPHNNQQPWLRPNTWLGDKQIQMHEIKIKIGNSIQGIHGSNGSGKVGWDVNFDQDPHLNLQTSFPLYILRINY